MTQITQADSTFFRGTVGQILDNPKLYHVEITLNAPRTKAFENLLVKGQKEYYRKRYNIMLLMFKDYIYESNYIFEHCKDGQVHLHAVWLISLSTKGSYAGLVSDISKVWLKTLSPKYSTFTSSKLYWFDEDQTICYKTASCKISLRINQEARFFDWFEYMCKTI